MALLSLLLLLLLFWSSATAFTPTICWLPSSCHVGQTELVSSSAVVLLGARLRDDDVDQDAPSATQRTYRRPQRVEEDHERLRKQRNGDENKTNRLQSQDPTGTEQRRNLFPGNGIRPGAELDVRIVRVHAFGALCRPVDLGHHWRGRIVKYELSEFDDDEIEDATQYREIAVGMVVRAQVMQVRSPDLLVLSLRRVRRVLADYYQPFTIVIFGLPDNIDVEHLTEVMRESGGGPVEDVKFLPTRDKVGRRRRNRSVAFVTFRYQADALAALRKWNMSKMPCLVKDDYDDDVDNVDGDDQDDDEPQVSLSSQYTAAIGSGYRQCSVRCRKANRQDYRDWLQSFLDYTLQQKIERWDETPDERRYREQAEEYLAEVNPYYYYDKMFNEDYIKFFRVETRTPAYQYSVKNEPGRAPQLVHVGTTTLPPPPPSRSSDAKKSN
jgi:hypothetical protein